MIPSQQNFQTTGCSIIGLAHYNTEAEVDAVLAALERILN
jgi:selenocysteine lyase/cysteine desulfurase